MAGCWVWWCCHHYATAVVDGTTRACAACGGGPRATLLFAPVQLQSVFCAVAKAVFDAGWCFNALNSFALAKHCVWFFVVLSALQPAVSP